MPNAAAIIAKLDKALKKVNVTDRDVYKRLVTRTGGDDLIGSPATISYLDTKLDPPPSYQRLGRNIVGNNVSAEEINSSGGDYRQIANDYAALVSTTAISLDELQNPDVVIVFKAVDGAEETFAITDYEPLPYQGVDLLYNLYLRSKARPNR